jgi:predicted nucleic acid-binding protein
LIDPQGPYPAVCRDPHDDYIVALARASSAEVIVTGDLDLLAIDPREIDIEIITPRQLIDRLG